MFTAEAERKACLMQSCYRLGHTKHAVFYTCLFYFFEEEEQRQQDACLRVIAYAGTKGSFRLTINSE